MTDPKLPAPEALAAMVSSVTETMFGMSFALQPDAAPTPWKDEPSWRTVLLPTIGARPVTVAVAADEPGARVLGSRMFGCEPTAVDRSMADDSLSELANIIAGQVKTSMGLDQHLGLPEILTHEARTARLGDRVWRAATLQSGAERAQVWVAVTPARI